MKVHPPTPSGPVAARCARLNNLLPQRLESLRPRVISPRSPLVHAWGKSAIILTCGVGQPVGYSATSSETTVVDNKVRWFQQQGSAIITWTAVRPGVVAHQPIFVQLQVPTHYQDQGPFLIDLTVPLTTALP